MIDPPGPELTLHADAGPRALHEAEWLLTNGIGGFAMGTALGAPRRKYHTWLNAPATPPVDRVATVNGASETLVVAGERFDLGGWLTGEPDEASLGRLAEGSVSFTRTPTEVVWRFVRGGVRVTKRLRLGWRRNCCAVRYELETGGDVNGGIRLEVRPLVSVRDMHDVIGTGALGRLRIRETARGFEASAGDHTVRVSCVGGSSTGGAEDVGPLAYDLETSRGQPDRERLARVGTFTSRPGEAMTLAVALAPQEPDHHLFDADPRGDHLRGVVQGMRALGPGLERLAPLAAAADDFLVRREVDGRPLVSVLAGYPWFADWGRDTMISLPGLMLSTGRFEDARGCLETFARHVSEGMIPNRFDDYGGPPHYNTVDASLWFLHAATEYRAVTGDASGFDRLLAPACVEIIEGYRRGTRYGIRMDPEDGLIAAGDETTQLTWMDAKREGVVFTPRHGKAVEIQALWRHGLVRVAEALADRDAARSGEYRALGDRVRATFLERFDDPETGGLHDCLQPNASGEWAPTGELRPNQIFAASLERSGLDDARRAAVVRVVRERLLTPVGLRTLAPGSARYRPRFEGDMMSRDAAYHNGTVWPWPIGAYCEAALRAGGWSDEARAHAAGCLVTLLEHMGSACLGQIAEVYDADEPRRQEGCTAQAWSVAEVLRVAALLATR
jgi:glycogen debranching enzyme